MSEIGIWISSKKGRKRKELPPVHFSWVNAAVTDRHNAMRNVNTVKVLSAILRDNPEARRVIIARLAKTLA